MYGMYGIGSGRGWLRGLGLVVGLLAAAMGCSVSGNVDVNDAPFVYRGDSAEVQMVSAVIGGKNAFPPQVASSSFQIEN